MWQQQGTITAKLVNLIQTLQLRRETGQLTARHGDGITTEEGIIVFVSGKVVEAQVGRRTGSEALNKLTMWENCLCWFVPTMDTATGPHLHTSPDEAAETFSAMQANMPASVSFHPPQTRTDPHRENNGTTPSSPVPGVPYHVSQLQPALSKIEQLGLSRTHRHLFLLIDGRRSVPDLIRLTGREKDDVYQLLQDLEQAILIRISAEQS